MNTVIHNYDDSVPQTFFFLLKSSRTLKSVLSSHLLVNDEEYLISFSNRMLRQWILYSVRELVGTWNSRIFIDEFLPWKLFLYLKYVELSLLKCSVLSRINEVSCLLKIGPEVRENVKHFVFFIWKSAI